MGGEGEGWGVGDGGLAVSACFLCMYFLSLSLSLSLCPLFGSGPPLQCIDSLGKEKTTTRWTFQDIWDIWDPPQPKKRSSIFTWLFLYEPFSSLILILHGVSYYEWCLQGGDVIILGKSVRVGETFSASNAIWLPGF